MPQTKKESAKEAAFNTLSAFLISCLAHKFVVAWALNRYIENGGNNADWAAAISVTLFYTLLSLLRNYSIRRIFDKREIVIHPTERDMPRVPPRPHHYIPRVDKDKQYLARPNPKMKMTQRVAVHNPELTQDMVKSGD